MERRPARLRLKLQLEERPVRPEPQQELSDGLIAARRSESMLRENVYVTEMLFERMFKTDAAGSRRGMHQTHSLCACLHRKRSCQLNIDLLLAADHVSLHGAFPR